MAVTDPHETRPEDELTAVLEEVRRIEVQSNRLVSSVMSGGYTSVFRGAGVEFDEVREYVEGDDPRLVDWSVTARQGRPFVKKYVDERELTLVFALDVSASMDGGFGLWSARQMGVRVLACLALAAVRNHDKVGLLTFASGVHAFVPPQKSRGHALRIVRDGLVARPPRDGGAGVSGDGRGTAFAAAFDYLGRVQRRRAVVFVVSDFLGFAGGRELLRCARRHDVVAVRLLSPELFPPAAGLLRVRDPESGAGAVIDWQSPRVRAAYSARVAAWRRRVQDDLDRAGVDLMDVAVPDEPDKDAVARPILRFFRMREQRGSKR